MQVVGDVKCYHCGHISGQVEGERTKRLVLRKFIPRQGYKGELPAPGQALRCERCSGPVFLEDLRAAPTPLLAMMPQAGRKRPKSSRNKAA